MVQLFVMVKLCVCVCVCVCVCARVCLSICLSAHADKFCVCAPHKMINAHVLLFSSAYHTQYVSTITNSLFVFLKIAYSYLTMSLNGLPQERHT